jgi:D-psicose/D-tagatose/L-ribulose 3-epimerase
MKFGMNLLLWTDDPTQERLLPLYERLAGMGYDGVELPIFDAQPRVEAYATLGRRLDDMGLARTAVAIRTPNDDPLSPDPAVRRAAVECTQRAIDCCEASGCALLCGPLYAVVGQFSGAGPTDEEWGRSVAVLRDAADYAARSDVTLALEYLNRFEIYLLNTAADTARFARDVARANLGVHYDTFHANIEEKDVSVAIEGCASQLRHVHISENDRGTPGKGHIDFVATAKALRAAGYDGWLTIEAFGTALPGLAAATRVWREFFPSREEVYEYGLKTLRGSWAATD